MSTTIDLDSASTPTNNTAPINPVQQSHDMSTLEEPVHVTIVRELKGIGRKLFLVLIPRPSNINELRDYDLWGPLMLCLTLAVTMGVTTSESGFVFGGVFVVVTIGAAVVTLNGQLLGGTLSFFQSVCILGYCIAPIVLCSLIFVWVKNYIARAVLIPVACVWACGASIAFLAGSVPPKRKLLAVFPIVLFYLFISWLVLVQA